MWVVLSYFPVSNIPVLLPTVRAERFWYFPALGTSLLLAIAFTWLLDRTNRAGLRGVGVGVLLTFLGFQAYAARRHANDYTDDLSFWDATRKSVPRSAKAHLNYSVMQGARGNLEIRLESSRTALELAPTWPMASVYLGDTLCRLHRAPEAWQYYKQGFELAPNDVNLIALGIQCLWDERMLDAECPTRDALSEVGDKYPGSWLDYLAKDTLEHGSESSHNGVDPKYRPRGYNEGPKD
jgi:tetratricopeptide (TPR) repeat protein